MATQTHGYMNKVERIWVHNRARWLLQKWWELPLLMKLGLEIKGKTVLEVGCGNGRAARAMKTTYGAKEVVGIDIDLSHLPTFSSPHAQFLKIDAAQMPIFPNGYFDTVVGFGLLHHVEQWQDAVAEIGRVLRPGGVYALDDFVSSGLKKGYHKVFEAPTENRFTTGQLIREIERNGMEIMDVTTRLFGDVVFCVARKL